jgi:hypothetical protein
MPSTPIHVFCATELRATHHLYLSRDFAYCYDYGLGSRPNLPIHTAVQASANLPGAFPTRWLRARPFGFSEAAVPRLLALTDGGVYDNMADQWFDEYRRRLERGSLSGSPVRAELEASAPDVVVVANASAALGRQKVLTGMIPLIGELTSLLEVKNILYDNGNSVRRTRIVRGYQSGVAGALVHIAASPYGRPDAIRNPPPGTPTPPAEIVDRATKVCAFLDGLGISRADWKNRATSSKGVGTQLWPLGRAATRAVIEHAYTLTSVQLKLSMDLDPIAPPPIPALA